ncbi:MAG: copper chaperone PCu(A)C [Streptomyces sp.]|uniref:copper chaperone PCu(A)C n=1 Tax=Streptomyces sp. TaxID=1931 RepID=UPI003D6B8B1C
MTRGRAHRSVAVVLAAAGALALSACGSGSGDARPELTVRGAYVPEPVTADMAAGFLTVRNTGAAGDTLTSVTSGISDDVQLHRTKGQQMLRVKALPVPANGELRLGRGGDHLMLQDLERKPKQGEKVRVTLHFEKSDAVRVSMPVEATNHVPEK